jgi:hypothetical protein
MALAFTGKIRPPLGGTNLQRAAHHQRASLRSHYEAPPYKRTCTCGNLTQRSIEILYILLEN